MRINTQPPISKKNRIITKLYNKCESCNNFVFTNSDVKQACDEVKFGNPFDVTKIDNIAKLPNILTKNDAFIIHLGQGKHKFAHVHV